MKCSCTLSTWADEDNEYYLDKWVKARKPHACCECQATIEIGERYESVVGKTWGRWWRYKTCLPCVEVRDCFFCSWTFTQVYEYMNDNTGDLNLGGLEELSPKARAKFFEKVKGGGNAEQGYL